MDAQPEAVLKKEIETLPGELTACDATITLAGSTSSGKDQEVYERLYPLYRVFLSSLASYFPCFWTLILGVVTALIRVTVIYWAVT